MSRFGKRQPSSTPGQSRFATIPAVGVPRSRFDRSHGHKTTFDASLLVPIYVDEVLPGDTFSLSPTLLGRLATPLHPVMDNLHMDVFFFFVPHRLVWDNFEKFMGERRPNTDSSIDYVIPSLDNGTGDKEFQVGSIHDYMGLPVLRGWSRAASRISALPFRAYNLIYNEWFRDENLIDMVDVPTDDGPDLYSDYALLRRGKRHDYFTSALPFPQKGPAVELPLGTVAPVTGFGAITSSSRIGEMWRTDTSTSLDLFSDGSAMLGTNVNNLTTSVLKTRLTNNQVAPGTFEADLSSATSATINEWREAVALQQFLEADMRGGTRYTEIIRGHFRVTSPDARLQRPEFLGGGTTPVQIAPVPATASTEDSSDDPLRELGDLGAVGMVVSRGGRWMKSFTEHGTVIGLVSVRADLTYQQGLDRMWSRTTRYDFAWPEFAHLGEQAVLRKEIFYTSGGNAAVQDTVFGYQERFAEYRYCPSRLSGLFRSDAPTSLDTWHLAQDFSAAPTLSQTFIEEDVPIERIVAVPSEPAFLLDCWFDLKCARPLPVYSVPGLRRF